MYNDVVFRIHIWPSYKLDSTILSFKYTVSCSNQAYTLALSVLHEKNSLLNNVVLELILIAISQEGRPSGYSFLSSGIDIV